MIVHPRYEYHYDRFGNQIAQRTNITQSLSGAIDDTNAKAVILPIFWARG